MMGQIKPNEQVARKKRSGAIDELSRVADGLQPYGQKDFKRLIFQLVLSAELAIRLGVDRIPAGTIMDDDRMRRSAFDVGVNVFGVNVFGVNVFEGSLHPRPEVRLIPELFIWRRILQVKGGCSSTKTLLTMMRSTPSLW
jgi:hypothetical protein